MKDRFRYVREQNGMSQREFGEALGVSRDVISNIEYGRVEPKDLIIQHMCDTFGVRREWIRTGEGEPFLEGRELDPKQQEAMKLFKSLRPEFQDYALEQIRKLLELQDK